MTYGAVCSMKYKPLQDLSIKHSLKGRLDIPTFNIKAGKETRKFLNCAFAIDIETTSCIDNNGREVAFPWSYQIGINEECFITSDYKAFYDFINRLNEWLINQDLYIHCTIHNLPYEFTFFSGFLNFSDVFAKENGKPLVCYCGNIRFIDTYQISGLSLEKLSKNYTKTKKIKDLDYKKWRCPESLKDLTDEEKRYLIDDVIILNEYWNSDEIQRYIKKQGYTKLPLTNTSKVRMKIYNSVDAEQRKKIINALQDNFPTLNIYQMLLRGFSGGVVKSNPRYTNIELYNVGQVDIASSYPTSLFVNFFPMSSFIDCDITSIEQFEQGYCYMVDVELFNVESTKPIRTISISKTLDRKNVKIDNGRIISADYIKLTLTDVDFKYLFKFYDFDYKITRCIKSKSGRMPKYFIKVLVDLYETKNRLKPLYEKDPTLKAEYLNAKGMLNSIYGMCVYKDKPVNYTYDGTKWNVEINENYHKFNKQSLLMFQWGVWTSAYSRAMLYDGILICGDDIIYSDTDSCKFLNKEKHVNDFNKWNIAIDKKVRTACAYYGIDFEIMRGLGRFDFESDVETFKTLGAKRYIHDGHITISGISDKAFCDYAKLIKKTPLECFYDGFNIPKEHTGKNTSKYYINNEKPYIYKYEYNGKQYELPIINYIYMCDAPWSMSLSKDYRNLLIFLHNVSRETLESEV